MRPIPTFGAEETGAVDPVVAAAMAEYARTGASGSALAALSRSRVLIPVSALPGDEGVDSAHLGTVLSTGRDGRQALLAFSCLASLARWRPAARPVPQPMRQAAQAALSEGAAALVVDLAGPVTLTIQGDDLRQLAAGLVLVRTKAGHAWALQAAAIPPRP